MKFRITLPPLPMETIYEQKMESPVMITSGQHQQQRFMMHGKNLANTGKPMTPISPLSPSESTSTSSKSPTSPSLAKKPSQIMRDWVKRSGSGSGSGQGRTTKHVATLSVPGHQRLPIVHLGGGRLGESDIEPSFPTGLRPAGRNPSIQREGSADSRVTQWIDLYPEAIERMNANGRNNTHQQVKHTRTMSESSTIKQTRWKFHPDHHAAAPPEIDPRPAPLRIPSAKKKLSTSEDDAPKPHPPNNTTLVRSDSKWKPLPILPAQQQATQPTQPVGKPSTGNGMPARKPLHTPHIADTIQSPKRNKSSGITTARPKTPTRHATEPIPVPVPTMKPTAGPVFPPPLTIYVTPPPTPDSLSETGISAEQAVEVEVPKLFSGPPALRINTGNPTSTSISPVPVTAESHPKPSKPIAAIELPADNPILPTRADLISPTTIKSDSLLSTDMDDDIKITIGMMCLNDLDFGLDLGDSIRSSNSQSQSQSQSQTDGAGKTARPVSPPPPALKASPTLTMDLDSPLAAIPALFSPISPTSFEIPQNQAPTVPPLASQQRLVSPTHSTRSRKRDDSAKEARGSDERVKSPVLVTSPISMVASPISISTSASNAATSVKSPSSTSKTARSPLQASDATRSRTTDTKVNTNKSITATPATTNARTRYTKEERMWLHQHYRGEAPFLRAWGLDIKSLADREEGVAILRDLMGMDMDMDLDRD